MHQIEYDLVCTLCTEQIWRLSLIKTWMKTWKRNMGTKYSFSYVFMKMYLSLVQRKNSVKNIFKQLNRFWCRLLNMHVLILNKHVICAHIPHASPELSEKHIYQEATILPTLKRVSRGLCHKAPPSIRISCSDCNVTGAYAVTIFRHTLTFAREEFFQQERMQPTVISWRHR